MLTMDGFRSDPSAIGLGCNIVQASLRGSADDLSAELWTLVFEELSVISPFSSDLRLVCHRFNDLATPFIYHSFKISSSVTGNGVNTACCQVKANIRSFTKRMVIDHDLNWDRVSELMRESKVLQDLEWRYGMIESRTLPVQIQDVLHDELPRIRLHIIPGTMPGILVMQVRAFESLRAYSIPSASLSTLRLTKLWIDVPLLQSLLVASARLEILEVCRDARFSIGGGRLPPIKELVLHDWVYRKEEVLKIWDFSGVEHLKIVELPMQKFLDSLPPHSFAKVRKLEYVERSSSVNQLRQLVDQIYQLEELDVVCLAVRELIPELAKHKYSLRVLKLRDLSGRRPKMDVKDIQEMARLCPNLVTLDIDLEISERDVAHEDPRLEVLASLHSLRRLKIRSQRDLHGKLANRNFAEAIKDHINRQKHGVPLLELTIVLRQRRVGVYRLGVGAADKTFTWSNNGLETFSENLTDES